MHFHKFYWFTFAAALFFSFLSSFTTSCSHHEQKHELSTSSSFTGNESKKVNGKGNTVCTTNLLKQIHSSRANERIQARTMSHSVSDSVMRWPYKPQNNTLMTVSPGYAIHNCCFSKSNMDQDVKWYQAQKKHFAELLFTRQQASLSFCSWSMLVPKNVLVLRLYYYYQCPTAQWSLFQRGWVGRGTRVLNNL